MRSLIWSCRAAIFAALAASAASRCAGLSCARRVRLPLLVRLLLVLLAVALAVLLALVLVVVIWTLPGLEPTPVREELRNRCPATHSPGPSGEELCSGAGSAGGGRPDKDCFRSAAPEGRKDLVRSGGDGAGGPYAELPDGSGDQQGQPPAGGR